MINDKYFIAFASDESFDCKFVKKLYDFHGGDIQSAWESEYTDLINIEGISPQKITTFLKTRDSINPDIEFDKLTEQKVSYITYDDNDYPELLRQIPDSPMCLYFLGNRELFQSKNKLAVVGSRKCSAIGKSVLSKIISEFQNSDLCVVSGLALGIDATAHQAALDNNIATIAVLGSGVKNIYPNQNKKLANDIINNNGLIISEYPVFAPPISYHFPQRNRIVSGISECTLVAEAAIKSGALITARLCLEQNRELMCIPGAINNPGTTGIYKLLKEGAGLVTCGDDILNNMGWNLNKKVTQIDKNNNFSDEENQIIALLRQDSLTIDEIALKTGLHVDTLMIILTRLELEDIIVQSEGNRYFAL